MDSIRREARDVRPVPVVSTRKVTEQIKLSVADDESVSLLFAEVLPGVKKLVDFGFHGDRQHFAGSPAKNVSDDLGGGISLGLLMSKTRALHN